LNRKKNRHMCTPISELPSNIRSVSYITANIYWKSRNLPNTDVRNYMYRFAVISESPSQYHRNTGSRMKSKHEPMCFPVSWFIRCKTLRILSTKTLIYLLNEESKSLWSILMIVQLSLHDRFFHYMNYPNKYYMWYLGSIVCSNWYTLLL